MLPTPDGTLGVDSMGLELLAFFISVGETFTKNMPISLALAAVFTVLTSFWACNPGRPWWKKPDLVTDLCYWFFIPVLDLMFGTFYMPAGALPDHYGIAGQRELPQTFPGQLAHPFTQ